MNSTLWTFALLHPWASNRIEYKRMPWRYTSLYWVWSSRRSETAFVTGELKIQNLMKITYSFYLIFDFARGYLLSPVSWDDLVSHIQPTIVSITQWRECAVRCSLKRSRMTSSSEFELITNCAAYAFRTVIIINCSQFWSLSG